MDESTKKKVIRQLGLDSILAFEKGKYREARGLLSDIIAVLAGGLDEDRVMAAMPKEGDTQPGKRNPTAVIDAMVAIRKHPDARKALSEAINGVLSDFAQKSAHHQSNGQDGFASYYGDIISAIRIVVKFLR